MESKISKTNRNIRVSLSWSIVVIAILFLITFVSYAYITTKMEGGFSVELDGIELTDVRPADCYEDFNPQFCPVPKRIRVDMQGNIPINMIGKLGNI